MNTIDLTVKQTGMKVAFTKGAITAVEESPANGCLVYFLGSPEPLWVADDFSTIMKEIENQERDW